VYPKEVRLFDYPKTNSMFERVNGTILKENYTNKKEMNNALMASLVHFMLY